MQVDLEHTEGPALLLARPVFQQESTGAMKYDIALDCRDPLELRG
jgi:hypothetical protein